MQYKTKPYKHQFTALKLLEPKDDFGLLMDMGTGKSKVIIDDATRLYLKKKIDTLIIIAPNGVHTSWILDQIPDHLPDGIEFNASFYSATGRAWHKQLFRSLIYDIRVSKGKLRILAFNIECASNKTGQQLLIDSFLCCMAMLVLDESSRIKNPSAKRTRFLCKLSRHAKYRRILTGTPITQAPLDLYAQFKFLNPNIIHPSTWTAFRARYAKIERIALNQPIVTRYKDKKGNQILKTHIDKIVGYKNLPELEKMIRPYCYRVLKKDCLDLPEKIYKNIYVELTPEQKRIYKQLYENSIAHLALPPPLDTLSPEQIIDHFLHDDKIVADNTLTKIMRLQQILGGHVADSEGKLRVIDNNRIKTLLDTIEDIQGSIIIWARFRAELAEIAEALEEIYPHQTVQYHGGVNNIARSIGVKLFQDKKSRFFVGQQRSGGIGLTLTAATTVIYYSNEFSLETRLQSEDRAHRIGQKHPVTYIDLISRGTVDINIKRALATKLQMAEEFNYG